MLVAKKGDSASVTETETSPGGLEAREVLVLGVDRLQEKDAS